MRTLHPNSVDIPSVSWLGRHHSILKPLLIGFSAALLALIFVQLGSEVVEGDTRIFDMLLLRGAQALRISYPWIIEVMRDVSGLGSTSVLISFTACAVGYLALISERTTAALVATSVITGSVVVSVFKTNFGRLRPDSFYAEFSVSGWSFPSGHASMSAIVFLTVGTLIACTRSRVAESIYILTTATLLTLFVGLSRVLLGVHWATDVLGGWAFGAAWAIAWLLLSQQINSPGGAKRISAAVNTPDVAAKGAIDHP